MNKAIPMLAVMALAALDAQAQSTPWYAGVAIGQAKTSSDLVSNREDTIYNATDLRTSFDDTDTAFRAFGGYRFNEHFALEANYTDFGKQRTDTTFKVGTNGIGSLSVDRQVQGFGLDLIGALPLADRFSVFARLGAFYSQTKADGEIAGDIYFTDGEGGTTRHRKFSETNFSFGLGAAYAFDAQWSARLEWQRVTDVGKDFGPGVTNGTGQADIDAVWLSVLYRF
jgi:OOP family OmpA-OmpF porin